MTDRHTDHERRDERGYPGEKARQGTIVLNTPTRRLIFFGGLVGFVLFVFVTMLLIQ